MLVSKKEEEKQKFVDGLSHVEVLPGTNPDMKIYRCTLQAGHDWQPTCTLIGTQRSSSRSLRSGVCSYKKHGLQHNGLCLVCAGLQR